MLRERGITDISKDMPLGPDAAAFWSKLRDSVSVTENPASWNRQRTDQVSEDISANVSALPDGSALVVLRRKASDYGEMTPSTEGLSLLTDPPGFDPACAELEDVAKLRRIL